jgi:hypothetical protein
MATRLIKAPRERKNRRAPTRRDPPYQIGSRFMAISDGAALPARTEWRALPEEFLCGENAMVSVEVWVAASRLDVAAP